MKKKKKRKKKLAFLELSYNNFESIDADLFDFLPNPTEAILTDNVCVNYEANYQLELCRKTETNLC